MESKIRNCWICGAVANSDEHKFKASILKRKYGKKYSNYELSYISAENETRILSFKSTELKFSKIICIDCNNNKTKASDDAYDLFVSYIDGNFDKMYAEQMIDFYEIYGNNWEEQKRNLYRYIAKYAGCKIVTHELRGRYDIKDLAEFILGKPYTYTFKMEFQFNVGIKYLFDLSGEKFFNLYNGPILIFGEGKNSFNYAGWTSYQWIATNWVLSNEILQGRLSDFKRQKESLSIQLFNPSLFEQSDRISEVMDKLEMLGKVSLDECVRYFTMIIESE